MSFAFSLHMRSKNKFSDAKRYYHSSPGFNLELWSSFSFEDRWREIGFALNEVRQIHWSFNLHALVMMSTHLHILFSCDSINHQYSLEMLKKTLLKNLNWQIVTEVFDGPIQIQEITNYQQLINTYRYIYRNPIEAGLIKNAEQYPYSTLPEILGMRKNTMSAIDTMCIIQSPFRTLNWFNQNSEFFFKIEER